jgi:hypothetical protein
LVIFLANCSPDDGTNGKDGANGTNGKDGINGTNGTQGPVGSANVIYSDWTAGSLATAENIDGTSGLSFLLPAKPITQNILDKATILVYFKFASHVIQLPYTSTAGGNINTIAFFPELGGIKIFRFNHSGVGTSALPASLTYRYIIIPGAVLSNKMSINFKKMTYEEVCNYFKLNQ